MNSKLCALLAVAILTSHAFGQGQIWFYTAPSGQTRIGSPDGPVAGPAILGQLLAGPAPDSLMPVGIPRQHNIIGIINGGVIEVPTVPCDTFGYVQLVVWDGTLWGNVLQNVPVNQLGATDVVRMSMTCLPLPTFAPPFTQPAIVPIPEPSVVALAGSGLVLVAIGSRRRHSKLSLCLRVSVVNKNHRGTEARRFVTPEFVEIRAIRVSTGKAPRGRTLNRAVACLADSGMPGDTDGTNGV